MIRSIVATLGVAWVTLVATACTEPAAERGDPRARGLISTSEPIAVDERCDARVGYHLVCESAGAWAPSWCPPSESCGAMDECQAAQLAACDESCPGGCVTIYDGPATPCDCAIDEPGPDGGVDTDGGDGDDGGGGDDGGDGLPPGCDGVPGSGATVDACGVCGGDGSSCGECSDGRVLDECGVCGGDGSSCGECPDGTTLDACGVCGGDGSSCGECPDGTTLDACGVCGGDGSSCGECPDGLALDDCGVCGGDDSTCAGCDGVIGSGLTDDLCGVCGGDGSSCAGCDGVPNSGVTVDTCGVCGGEARDGDRCGDPPPPPAREYVMSLYFVPADGADGARPLVGTSYGTPTTLLAALAQSRIFGSGHKNQGFVHIGHEVGHAYVSFLSRDVGGANEVVVGGYPTGQTGDGGFSDYVNTGAGGTILGIYAGRMNTVPDAKSDIDLRSRNHGTGVIVVGPGGIPVGREASAQLISRIDILLSEATWRKAQARVTLHTAAGGASTRYGLLLEPSIKSRHPGEVGGEGAGCTSFAAMLAVYTGALKRTAVNPHWTRQITFGERTIGRGTYRWGSHLLAPWSTFNVVDGYRLGDAASTYLSAWTFDEDRRLDKQTITTGLTGATTQTKLRGYWYDPDLMYFWTRSVYQTARRAANRKADAAGVTWTAKHTRSPDALGGFPYLELDARGATAHSDWDRARIPLTEDWLDEE